ncbi:hypothetical protein D3C85_1874470 [compost metagenome]
MKFELVRIILHFSARWQGDAATAGHQATCLIIRSGICPTRHIGQQFGVYLIE